MNNNIKNYQLPSLGNLESTLSRLLQPVKPDNDFVNTLKTKLTQVPTIVVDSTKRGSRLLFVGLGVIVGIAAIWLIGKSKGDNEKE
jgi:hypothetical protein